MKLRLLKLTALLTLLVAISLVSGKVAGFTTLHGTTVSYSGDESTTTVQVTVTAINLATNTITLKDRSGKIYVFTVDPTKIDLKKYKVGQTFTATIATSTTTNQVTRARITKADLLKLQ
ncbi:MAG TPA: hypothetical protein PLW67_03765 [Prolixibacteraceae bacterium]|nr:hypothetical protein [Prolixibacteraceae bacterium]